MSLALATLATTLSLAIAVLTGWERGISIDEKIVWATFGMVAVGGAHFLPSNWNHTATIVRLFAMLVWVTCMMVVAHSHASYFLLSQQQAGMARVAALDPTGVIDITLMRSLALILREQARVEAKALAVASRVCAGECPDQKKQIQMLHTQSEALIAEADEVRRALNAQARREAMQETVRTDPVTSRLVTVMGVTESQLSLGFSALAFFFVLDGLACFGWLVVIRKHPRVCPESGATECPPMVTTVVTPSPTDYGQRTQKVMSSQSHGDVIHRLTDEVRAERFKPTVASVRQFLKCSQKQASTITRELKAVLASDAGSASSMAMVS